MAKKNSINQESNPLDVTALTVDNASLNAEIQFIISPDILTFGSAATDNTFRMANSTLTTNSWLNMSENGAMALPFQPCYLARLNSESNVTGDGTVHTIGATTATTQRFDQNGDYSPGNGSGTGASFTAPVTGRYACGAEIEFSTGSSSSAAEFKYEFVSSNRTYTPFNFPSKGRITDFYGPNSRLDNTSLLMMDMDSGDTLDYQVTGSGGTKTNSIVSRFLYGTLLN